MTEFFANSVAADYMLLTLILTQIPIIFIYATRMYCRMYAHFALSRNPEWIAGQPEFTRHTNYEKAMRIFANIIAVLSLASVVYYIFQNPDPMNIVAMLLLPQLAWLIGILLYTVVLYFKVTRAIPLQDHRRTILEDRSLAAYVRPWMVSLGYIGLFFVGSIYLWALFSETIPIGLATARLIGFVGMIILGTGVLAFALRRKHSELEFMFGENGRKLEVRSAVIMLYIGIFIGLYRILGDFFDIHLFTTGTFFIVVSMAIQGWLLAMYKYTSNKLTLR